ncbi:MAG: hypothetical protein ACRERV_14960 [Methylococcales bacterium]
MQTTETQPIADDDMMPEYHFDYSKARANRFAVERKPGSSIVVLDPDIAAVFTTPESVNAVLRALIYSMARVTRG